MRVESGPPQLSPRGDPEPVFCETAVFFKKPDLVNNIEKLNILTKKSRKNNLPLSPKSLDFQLLLTY